MPIRFNADEVLRIAVLLEDNGAAFYAEAAELSSCTPSKGMLLGLAEKEREHARMFTGMLRELSETEREPTAYDPFNEMEFYLEDMAKRAGALAKNPPIAEKGTCPTVQSILATALEKEQESITFYTCMRELVPPKLGRERISKIIQEEVGHVADLHREMAALK